MTGGGRSASEKEGLLFHCVSARLITILSNVSLSRVPNPSAEWVGGYGMWRRPGIPECQIQVDERRVVSI